eukprot:1878051-Ditylum_brightwellii.AAC.1
MNHWEKHLTYEPNTGNTIYWVAIGLAREIRTFHQQQWGSELAADLLPVECVMQDRELWQTAAWPRNCGEEMETPCHIMECRKADGIWKKLMEILCKWGPKADAAP